MIKLEQWPIRRSATTIGTCYQKFYYGVSQILFSTLFFASQLTPMKYGL